MTHLSPSAVPVKDRVVLITGGTSGIGRAAALRMAAEGARVMVSSRRQSAVDDTLAELAPLAPPGHFAGTTCDVADPTAVHALVDHTLERFGRLDIVVHSAGMLRLGDSGLRMLANIHPEEMHAVINTNVKGTFYINRAAARVMMDQGGGVIINIASILGRIARSFTSVYCASKFAMIGLTESFAEEMHPYGIRVMAVLPDAVKTPFWESDGPQSATSFALEPSRVADLIHDLATLPPSLLIDPIILSPFRTDPPSD
ncbi:MAG TPA: SDR family oxidoreductase [Kiritimatiellia bacterium]|nr:SDR family oxidoreductase [Kiritimatiellia bacterium]